MKRVATILATLVVVVVVAGAAVWYFKPGWIGMAPMNTADGKPAAAKPGRAGGAGGPVPVEVGKVERKQMPFQIEVVGTVQPIASIPVKPRLDSQVLTVNVAEGAVVKEGDLLFTLDSRLLRAQADQITAQIGKDKAQVDQARLDLRRAEDLAAKGASSMALRDTAATAVKAIEAQLAFDEAALASITTQLTFTEMRAPVSGRIGSIVAKPGAIVRMADTAPLAIVNQMDPIYIAFSVPQSALNDLRAAMAKGPVRVEARAAGNAMAVGEIAFLENTIDITTGTVIAKARMANADEKLWPGAFVPARIVMGEQTNAVTIPASALQIGQNGPFVYVVRDGRAVYVTVKVARTINEDVILSSGLNGGEQVVTSGQLRLSDGVQVTTAAPKPPAKPANGKPPAEAKN